MPIISLLALVLVAETGQKKTVTGNGIAIEIPGLDLLPRTGPKQLPSVIAADGYCLKGMKMACAL